MHMADALVTPAVAGTMYACSTAGSGVSLYLVCAIRSPAQSAGDSMGRTDDYRSIKMIRIHVEDVSFSYEPGMEILKHISFDMKEGESVGLIGANGAGKSTLLKLLVGLNMDYSGTIQVGEYPVSKQYLPQLLFMVYQEIFSRYLT